MVTWWILVIVFLICIQNITLYNICQKTESFNTPLWNAWNSKYPDVINKSALEIEEILKEIKQNTKQLSYYSKTNIVNM